MKNNEGESAQKGIIMKSSLNVNFPNNATLLTLCNNNNAIIQQLLLPSNIIIQRSACLAVRCSRGLIRRQRSLPAAAFSLSLSLCAWQNEKKKLLCDDVSHRHYKQFYVKLAFYIIVTKTHLNFSSFFLFFLQTEL